MTRRAWAAFVAVSVIWGLPYFFIRIALADLSPVFIAWSRLVLGAAILLPLAWRSGALRGLRSHLLALAAFAAADMAVPYVLISVGERFVASSLAAILIAAVPLMVALLAIRFAPDERHSALRLVGLFVGLGGVVVLLGLDVGGRPLELLGAACALLAAVCYAIGPLIVKRKLSTVDPLGAVTVSLVLGAAALAAPAMFSAPRSIPPASTLAAVAVLGVVCTAIGMFLYFFLIAEAGPSRTTIITYLNPAVAVSLGVVFLGERVGAVVVAGLLLILAGSWLSTGGRTPPGPATVWRHVAAPVRRVRARADLNSSRSSGPAFRQDQGAPQPRSAG